MNISQTAVALLCWIIGISPACAEVRSWDCQFEYRIDEAGKTAERMLLIFRIDTITGRAFMEGNLGFVDVDVHVGDSAFTFMEKPASGIVQTTTVTGGGLAVHSRNTVIFGEIVAAQHFGTCAAN